MHHVNLPIKGSPHHPTSCVHAPPSPRHRLQASQQGGWVEFLRVCVHIGYKIVCIIYIYIHILPLLYLFVNKYMSPSLYVYTFIIYVYMYVHIEKDMAVNE